MRSAELSLRCQVNNTQMTPPPALDNTVFLEGKTSAFGHWLGFFTAQGPSQPPAGRWQCRTHGTQQSGPAEGNRDCLRGQERKSRGRSTLTHKDQKIQERVPGNSILKTRQSVFPSSLFFLAGDRTVCWGCAALRCHSS